MKELILTLALKYQSTLLNSVPSGRVSPLQSVVAGSISSGGDHGMHC